MLHPSPSHFTPSPTPSWASPDPLGSESCVNHAAVSSSDDDPDARPSGHSSPPQAYSRSQARGCGFEPPMSATARDAMRGRERFQSAANPPPRQPPPAAEPMAQLWQQQLQHQQQALEFQFASNHLNHMAQLVQNAQAMVNGSFWPTWSPYVTVAPSLPCVVGTPYFSPYYAPFDPRDNWSTAGAFGAGMLGAGVIGAGLLGCGVVANTLGHAVGSTFGGGIRGLIDAFCW